MKYNIYNFTVGEIVILDADFRNWSKVKIKAISPNGMFATIHDPCEDESKAWDVMMNRLSPVKY